jgi:hypothetical protein
MTGNPEHAGQLYARGLEVRREVLGHGVLVEMGALPPKPE